MLASWGRTWDTAWSRFERVPNPFCVPGEAIVNMGFIFLCSLLVLQPLAIDAEVQPGISNKPPPGYLAYNLDPTLTNTTENGLVFDPNFIPGFQIGLPNTSVYWSTGVGYGKIGYWIGPWDHVYHQVPHLAVGPQNSNFEEIPRTQQFRLPSWGDYYYVKAGFAFPGVNIPN